MCYRHEELYDFVKYLWPNRQGQRLDLYLPNWPEFSALMPRHENKYGWQLLEIYGRRCGFENMRFQTVSRSYPRQPGHSPGRVDFRKFYGFGYFHRNNFIVSAVLRTEGC